MVSSTSANFYQFGGRKCGKLLTTRFLITQITPDQATVGLTDLNKQLTRLMVCQACDIETPVGLTMTKNWDMKHKKISGFRVKQNLGRGLTRIHTDKNKLSKLDMVHVQLVASVLLILPDSRISAFIRGLIDSFYYLGLQARKRTNVAHAVPRIEFARRLPFRLVTFEKARHKEFLCQRRQTNSTRFTIVNNSVWIIRIHYFDHRSRLRRIIDEGEIVFRLLRFVHCKSH